MIDWLIVGGKLSNGNIYSLIATTDSTDSKSSHSPVGATLPALPPPSKMGNLFRAPARGNWGAVGDANNANYFHDNADASNVVDCKGMQYILNLFYILTFVMHFTNH